MKLLILSVLVLSAELLYSQNDFYLEGYVNGLNNTFIRLCHTDSTGKYLIDSTLIRDGKFVFYAPLSYPTLAELKAHNATFRADDRATATFWLEPARMTIHLDTADFRQAAVEGSATQRQFDSLLASENGQGQKGERWHSELVDIYGRLQKDSGNTKLSERLRVLQDSLGEYIKAMDRVNYAFINTHPCSYISPYLLFETASRLPNDTVVALFDRLSLEVRRGSDGKEMQAQFAGYPGARSADFTATDMQKRSVHLAELNHLHIVILDFWASWCVPCRQSNPHLLQLYDKYRSKGLSIIGVARDDDNHTAWKKAVGQDSTGVFYQVLERRGQPDDIGRRFGVGPIPTKILIDQNGIIVGRYVGWDGQDKQIDQDIQDLFARWHYSYSFL